MKFSEFEKLCFIFSFASDSIAIKNMTRTIKNKKGKVSRTTILFRQVVFNCECLSMFSIAILVQTSWQPNHLTLNSFESDLNWFSNQLHFTYLLPSGFFSKSLHLQGASRRPVQPTLKRFFQPTAPDALKPALPEAEVKRSVGRQMSPRMAEIYKEVLGEAAESALKKRKLDSSEILAASPPSSAKASQQSASPASSSKDSVVRALSFDLGSPASEKDLKTAANRLRRKAGRPPGKKNSAKRILEVPVAAKLKIAKELSAAVEEHADPKTFWKEMRQKYGTDTRTLKKILEEKDELSQLVHKRSLSKNPLVHSQGKSSLKSRNQCRYKGFRKPGAGRKAKFPDVQQDLKAWSEEQRAYGHTLTREVLLDKYLMLLQSKKRKLPPRLPRSFWKMKKLHLCHLLTNRLLMNQLVTLRLLLQRLPCLKLQLGLWLARRCV